MLDISAGTVKSQTSRALGTLRKRLAAEGLAPSLPEIQKPVPAAQPAPVPSGEAERPGSLAAFHVREN